MACDVEEFHQVRGQRRKLTKAPFVISMLKPMSDDSRNFPLIVLEAFKDILCDFREARTGRQAWRPMARSPEAFSPSEKNLYGYIRAYSLDIISAVINAFGDTKHILLSPGGTPH